MSQQVTTPVKPKDSNVPIYSFSNKEINLFTAIKLLDNDSTLGIVHYPNSTEITPDFTATVFRTPSEDATVCAIYRGNPAILISGSPKKRFIYYAVSEGLTIPYTNHDITGSDLSSGNLVELGLGFYYLTMDINYPKSIVIVNDVPFVVSSTIEEVIRPEGGSGEIKLSSNTWQLIAIPREGAKVKEYFCDRLSSKYGASSSDMIEVCSAFFGDENKFRSYIPGVTKASTSNNFPLVWDDDGRLEITGFWVKMKDLSAIVDDVDNVTLSWES